MYSQVALAESLNAKVIESSVEDGDGNDQASNVVKRSLASLGLSTPAVTPDMMRDEQEYHRRLAKELATVLLGSGKGAEPIMQDGKSQKGLVGLDEIWCMWNRARGVGEYSTYTFVSAEAD
jgi:ESCRT-II complex subunit VPS36